MNLIQIRYRIVIPRPKLPKLRSHYLLAVKFRKKKHFVGVVFYWDNFVERLSCHRDKWSFPTRKGFDNFCLKIKLCIWIISIYSYTLRRPQNFEKSSPYFWLQYIQSRWRFRKILWPSRNIWIKSNQTSLKHQM